MKKAGIGNQKRNFQLPKSSALSLLFLWSVIVHCFLLIKTKTHVKALTSTKNEFAVLFPFFSLQEVLLCYKYFRHFENGKKINNMPKIFEMSLAN